MNAPGSSIGIVNTRSNGNSISGLENFTFIDVPPEE